MPYLFQKKKIPTTDTYTGGFFSGSSKEFFVKPFKKLMQNKFF